MREASASTATAINFPQTLAWATTAHNIQGHTVKKPDQLILDLDCWLQPAMIHVMLSRVQCLSQLFILDILPTNKIKPWPDAIDELARLGHIDIGKPKQISPSIIEIISLNIRSLPAHIDHIKADYELMSAQLILGPKHCKSHRTFYTKMQTTTLQRWRPWKRHCNLFSSRVCLVKPSRRHIPNNFHYLKCSDCNQCLQIHRCQYTFLKHLDQLHPGLFKSPRCHGRHELLPKKQPKTFNQKTTRKPSLSDSNSPSDSYTHGR